MSQDSEPKTGYLNLPDAQPMQDRPESPQTDEIGPGWKLRVIINDSYVQLDIADSLVVGRFVEGDDPNVPMLDLGPFDGYRHGVSRRHALITRQDNFLYVEDQGSTNGTRINGFQLTPRRKYRLRNGDNVEFSRLPTTFRFVRPG